MINVTSTLQHLDIDSTNVNRAVKNVGDIVGDNASKASKILVDLLGLNVEFSDKNFAQMVAKNVVKTLVESNCMFEDDQGQVIVDAASAAATEFMADPKNSFMFVEKDSDPVSQEDPEAVAVVAGIDLKVSVNKDGKIKKGGKGLLAAEMYKKHILDATPPMSNKDFIALLMSSLQMSKAGANTYLHNLKKANEPK